MNTDFIRKLNIGLKYCLGDIHRTYVGKYDTVIDCGEFVRAEATIEAEGLRARAEDKFFPYGEGFEAVCGMTILNSQGIDGFGACYYFETYKKFGELRFFMPSCWYGNNSLMADGSSKCNYYGDIAGGSIDGISAPFLFSFCDGNAVCLTVADPGYGTVAGERVGSCVLAECTLPSIGIVERKSIKLFVENPGNTYNDGGEGVTTFRYRTARENLRIETKFTVNCGSYPDFCSAMRGIWRDYFGKFAVFNRDIDTGIARKAIFDGVVRSMGRVNGIPQFMTNCDHFVPESGFLYRNSDLAYLTLKEGYRRGDGELIGFATDVIDCQVKNAYAGENQFFPFDRSRAEGCHSILKAYGFLKEQGTEKPEWLNYALREKEYFSSRDEFYSVPLLLEFGEVAVASEKARRIFDENFSKMLFYGGITDFGGGKRCIDRESALKGLEIFLALYEYTGESHWLEKASFCADYLETYQNLQLIPFNTDGACGTEHYNMASPGNEHFKTNGISFISSNCRAADAYLAESIPLFYKLYSYLDDRHYLDFALYIESNSLQCIDLYNKAGKMCDCTFGSGTGFINEYYQLASSCDVVGPLRGAAHNSDIAWCPYVFLAAQEKMFEYTGRFFIEERSCESMYIDFASAADVTVRGRYEGETEALSDHNFNTVVKVYSGCRLSFAYGTARYADKIVIGRMSAFLPSRIEVCLDGEFAGKYDLTDKLFATVFIGKEISRIEIVFSEDDFVREIQVFGPGKFPDGSTKKCKQFSTMNKYLPGGGECIPFVIRDGVTTDMRFDSERTEYNTVLEPYVCFKSASIFHLGKETDVGYRFRPGLSGIHKMILFVRPYLFDGETFDKSYSIKLVKNGKIVRDYSSDFNVVQGVICEEETEFGADDVIEVVFPRVDDNSCCQIDSQIYIL